MPAQDLQLYKIVACKLDSRFTDGRIYNKILMGTQNGEENDVRCCCVCFIAANSRQRDCIACRTPKTFHLETISTNLRELRKRTAATIARLIIMIVRQISRRLLPP